MKRRRQPATAPDLRVERVRGRKGQQMRKRRLARSRGLCEHCLDQGVTAAATQVNHKTPLAFGGPDEDWNTENLCEACHLKVTAEQFGFASTAADRGVDQAGRPTAADHPWSAARSTGVQPNHRKPERTPGAGQNSGPPATDTAIGPPYAVGSVSK